MSHMRTHRKEAISVQAMWKRFFTEDAFWGKNKNVAILEIAGTTLYNGFSLSNINFFICIRFLTMKYQTPVLFYSYPNFIKKSIFILFWMLFRGFLGHKRSLAGPKPNFFIEGLEMVKTNNIFKFHKKISIFTLFFNLYAF